MKWRAPLITASGDANRYILAHPVEQSTWCGQVSIFLFIHQRMYSRGQCMNLISSPKRCKYALLKAQLRYQGRYQIWLPSWVPYSRFSSALTSVTPIIITITTADGTIHQWNPAHENAQIQTIDSLQHKNVKSIACGTYHAAALTRDGQLYTWYRYRS